MYIYIYIHIYIYIYIRYTNYLQDAYAFECDFPGLAKSLAEMYVYVVDENLATIEEL